MNKETKDFIKEINNELNFTLLNINEYGTHLGFVNYEFEFSVEKEEKIDWHYIEDLYDKFGIKIKVLARSEIVSKREKKFLFVYKLRFLKVIFYDEHIKSELIALIDAFKKEPNELNKKSMKLMNKNKDSLNSNYQPFWYKDILFSTSGLVDIHLDPYNVFYLPEKYTSELLFEVDFFKFLAKIEEFYLSDEVLELENSIAPEEFEKILKYREMHKN